MDAGLAVSDAAERLSVSQDRVRALVYSGDLPAQKVGGRWLIDPDAVDHFDAARKRARPMSPRMAWGFIALVERGAAPRLSAPERSRIRSRLLDPPSVGDVANLLRKRADVHRLRVHPSALSRAAAWDGAVRSGVSAPGHDIIDADMVELYLPERSVNEMRRGLRAHDAAGDANLVVRIPLVDHWPFSGDVAGPVNVAVDLWDARDSRSRRAAERLYRRALVARRFVASP